MSGAHPMHYPALKRRKRRFETLRKRELCVTRHCNSIDAVTEIANQFDAVIVGSDQMWNPGIKDFSRAYFLPGVYSKKYTYSVSLGSKADGVSQALLIENADRFDGREQFWKDYLGAGGIESAILKIHRNASLRKTKYYVKYLIWKCKR